MMNIYGQLTKLAANLEQPVQYQFVLNNEYYSANEWLGKQIQIVFRGEIQCLGCDQKIKKSYQQGFCFLCTQKLAQCDFCILKPEKCHFHLGTCREPEWGKKNCFIPHIVYLANSSGVKVGITRETQIPTRWIDQGAVQALPILRVNSRYQAGLVEVEIAKYISDKTNWRQMLKSNNEIINLEQIRDDIFPKMGEAIQKISGQFKLGDIEMLTNETVVNIEYPVIQYLDKITSLNLDKTPDIRGKLLGIKGQYLILDSGVINFRKYSGYWVEIGFI